MQAHDYGLKYFKNKTNFQGLVVFSDKEQNQFESTLPSSPNIYIEIEKVGEDSNNWLLHLNSRLSGDYGDFFAANKPPFGEINESEYNFDQEKFSVLQGFVVDAPNGMIPYYEINEKLYLKVSAEIQLDEVFIEATRKADIEVKPSETVVIEYDAYISLFVSSNGAKLERAYQNITNINSNEVVILIESNEGSNVFGTVLRIHKGENVKTLPEVDRLTISKIAKAYGVTIETHDLTAIIKEELVDNKSAFYISVTKSLKYGGRVIRWASDEVFTGVSGFLKDTSKEINDLKLGKEYWQTEVDGKPNKDFVSLLPRLQNDKEGIDTKAFIKSIYNTYINPLTEHAAAVSKTILKSKFIKKIMPFDISNITKVLDRVPELLQEFFDTVIDVIIDYYYFINGLLVGLINSIIEFIASFFDILAMLFDVLNGAIQSTKFFDNPSSYISLFAESFENLIDGFLGLFTLDNLKTIVKFLAGLPVQMAKVLIGLTNAAKNIRIDPGALGFYLGYIVGFVASEVVTFFLTGGTGTIAKVLRETLRSYKALIKMPLKAGRLVGKTVKFGIDTFTRLIDVVADFIKNIPKHIDTLKSWIDEFINSLKGFANQIFKGLEATLDLLYDLGVVITQKIDPNTGKVLVHGVDGAIYTVKQNGKTILEGTEDAIRKFAKRIDEINSDGGSGKKKVQEYIDDTWRFFDKIGASGKEYKKFRSLERVYVSGSKADFEKKVTYFNDAERLEYEIFVQHDKIVDYKGNLLDTSGSLSINAEGSIETNRAIFVMSKKGNIYVSKYNKVGEFHHSTFLSGDEVAAAGEIVVKNGVIELVTDGSGHYTPQISMIKENLLEELFLRDYFFAGTNKRESINFISDF